MGQLTWTVETGTIGLGVGHVDRRKVKYQWNSGSIRALRDHMGMTQQQMAEELGTRQQTISEWETGMYRPRGGMNRLLTLVAEQAGFEYQVTAEATSPGTESGEMTDKTEEA
jgi:DNA-binding XRE family transcriptional regulator